MKKRFANTLNWKNKRSGKNVLLAVVVCVYQEDMPEQMDMEAEDAFPLPEAEEIPPVEEVSEEDIYEVLETEDGVYWATRYGICRMTEDGSDWIYKAMIGHAGFAGTEPEMKIFENRLYLKTSTIYKDGDVDWIDTGIRWIDLETLETGILDLDLGSDYPTISSFYFYDNLLNVKVNENGPSPRDMWFLAPMKESVVYNGKTIGELTEQERQEYGCETSQRLLEHPGTLLDISNHTVTGPFALVDMNLDGKTEEIRLQMATAWYERYDIFNRYSLFLDGKAVIEDSYSDNMDNKIWAVSLDGEEVVIVLYEDGPSCDPYTRMFRYEAEELLEIGAFGADIRECEITEDGIISGRIRRDIIETSFIHMSWQMNEEHRLEEVPKDSYDFVRYDGREGVMLLEELILHNEPNGDETFGISPQEVNFLQVSGDWRWVLLETADGVRGWFEVEDSVIVELDKQAWEVFEGLSFAG
uniref:hypothetical protein n=1 Tax=Acetatifactor sp. TaxID=1872090 RepID=UPI004056EBF3